MTKPSSNTFALGWFALYAASKYYAHTVVVDPLSAFSPPVSPHSYAWLPPIYSRTGTAADFGISRILSFAGSPEAQLHMLMLMHACAHPTRSAPLRSSLVPVGGAGRRRLVAATTERARRAKRYTSYLPLRSTPPYAYVCAYCLGLRAQYLPQGNAL